jgi:hypothetical protein
MKLAIDDDLDTIDEADGGSPDPPIMPVPQDASEEYRLRHGDKKLNINQVATHFHLKRHAVVEKLRYAGIDPAEVTKRGAKLFWLTDVQDVLTEGKVQGKATEKAEAQTRVLEANAGLKELELERKLGDSISVIDVEQGAVELFRALHNRLTMYASDAALDISKLKTRGDVEKYQKDHFATILEALRANPTNFITKYLSE